MGEYAAGRNPKGYTEADVPRLIKEVRAGKPRREAVPGSRAGKPRREAAPPSAVKRLIVVIDTNEMCVRVADGIV